MAHAHSDEVNNRLLAALPRKDLQLVLAGCEQVSLELFDILQESHQRIRHVYFPLNCFASLITTTEDRDRLEVSMVGNEGMLGASLVLGVDVPLLQGIVQGPGLALRMKGTAFRQALEESPALRRRMERYVYVMMRQLAQTASCMRFHLLEERLARWLLMTQDRAQAQVLHLTQEFLSNMLGVRRVGVSKAATNLQQNGLISYSRGEIRILDRAGLIDASCACYEADLRHYGLLLDSPVRAPKVNRRSQPRPDLPRFGTVSMHALRKRSIISGSSP